MQYMVGFKLSGRKYLINLGMRTIILTLFLNQGGRSLYDIVANPMVKTTF